MKNLLFKSCLFMILLLPLVPASGEVPLTVQEYQVKAMFLFNFTKFVTWPDRMFPTATAPVFICVLGEDPFLGKLNDILKGHKTQGGRSLELRYFQTVEMTKNCHILFISNSEQGRLANVYAFLEAYPVLTVSDIKDFVRNGGMIEFYTRESKIRFFIDPQTVREANLQVSSRLLQVADVVGSGK